MNITKQTTISLAVVAAVVAGLVAIAFAAGQHIERVN